MGAPVDVDRYSIQTHGLNLWYGDFQALKEVAVSIKRGIITSLIGPSGCGKTTLLRCFNRINERYGNVKTTGEVRILGTDIYGPSVSLLELRKRVGMVFQRPNPLPISIYENVVFGLKVHSAQGSFRRGALDQIAEESLREVLLWDGVKDRLRARATSLQLEEQQKLCIARLLPTRPEVILMDEPCSALDAKSTSRIEELMARLREKYTIVIVTHNMAQARRASDECIYMLLGEIVEHRATDELFFHPQDPRTEAYIEGRYG
jgi:phosphate transport system ATP-binding protein